MLRRLHGTSVRLFIAVGIMSMLAVGVIGQVLTVSAHQAVQCAPAAPVAIAVHGAKGSRPGQYYLTRCKARVAVSHLPHAQRVKPFTKSVQRPPAVAAPASITPASATGRVARPGLQAHSALASAPRAFTLSGNTNGTLEELEQIAGVGNDGPTPPDNGFGVGPNHIVAMVNSTGAVFAQTPGHPSVQTFNLSTFFGAPIHPTEIPNAAYSDPRVLYDSLSGRWFASILIFDSCSTCTTFQNSEVDIAVSASADPTGSWQVYTVETTNNNVLLDQPKLGVSNDKAVMTYNEHGFSGPYRFVEIQKSDLIGLLGSVHATLFGLDSSHYNVIPVVSLSSTNTEYAASANRGSSTLTIFQFTGTPSGGDASYSTTDLSIASYPDPPQADQRGDSRQIDTGTAGVQSAVWQNNSLWAAGNTKCTPPGDSVERPCLRFDRVSTSGTPSLVQDANLGQNGADLFYPAITVDRAGNLYAGHSVSSSTQFPTAGMTFFAGGTLASVNPGIDYQIGAGPYDCTFCVPPNDTRNRWGDYSGAAQDPNNPNDVWLNAEWGSSSTISTNQWATEIGRFTDAAPSVTGVAPNHAPELSPCDPVVSISGADFQLGASVSFGGVASPSVTVTAPETIQALAPSEAHGAVDVTVTTSAGTSATSGADVFTYDPDTIPPTTTASYSGANGAGWNNADFTVSFSAVDNPCGSGVKNITLSASGAITLPPTVFNGSTASLIVGTEGVTTISYFATDNAGNVEATNTLTVRLDKTAPTVAIAVPTATTYLLNQPVAADYSCADALSGVATCTGTVASGSNIDTSSLGTKTFTVTATDVAGNTSTASVTYTVSYNICLLYNPMQPHHNQVPIKLELCDFNNVNLSSASTVLTAVSVTPAGSVISPSNPGNLFRFDPTIAPGGGYIYNLNTHGLPPGVYSLNFTVTGDPNMRHALFTLA